MGVDMAKYGLYRCCKFCTYCIERKQKRTESIYHGSHGGIQGLGNDEGEKKKVPQINRKKKKNSLHGMSIMSRKRDMLTRSGFTVCA